MRVVHVVPNLGVGGAEVMIRDLAEAQMSLGHAVHIVSLWPAIQTFVERDIAALGIPVTYLNKAPGLDLRVFHRLRRLSWADVDVVHTHRDALRYVALARLPRDPPIVHTLHNTPRREAATLLDQLLRRWLFRSQRVLPIALTPALATATSRFYRLTQQCQVVENGIPAQIARHALAFCDRAHRIAYIGRLTPDKNPELLIPILRLILDRWPDVRLDVFGEGPLHNGLVERVSREGMSEVVRFRGVVSNARDLLHNFGFLLNTSRVEGQPITIIEAMAQRVAVIAANVGGVFDLLGASHSGLVDERGDPKKYAAAYTFARSDPHGTETTLRRLSDDCAETHSANLMAEQYLNLYRTLLG